MIHPILFATAHQELIKAWATIDADYDLRIARDSFSTDPRAPRPDGGQVIRGIWALDRDDTNVVDGFC